MSESPNTASRADVRVLLVAVHGEYAVMVLTVRGLVEGVVDVVLVAATQDAATHDSTLSALEVLTQAITRTGVARSSAAGGAGTPF